jgi:hypothetical protein
MKNRIMVLLLSVFDELSARIPAPPFFSSQNLTGLCVRVHLAGSPGEWPEGRAGGGVKLRARIQNKTHFRLAATVNDLLQGGKAYGCTWPVPTG